MARPISITDEQILDAAREVFLREGFGGSTLEIARIAGISEASIFRRFVCKEALFRAAIKTPEVPSWVRELDRLPGDGEVRTHLVQIVREIVKFAQARMPFVMLGWSYPAARSGGDGDEEPPIERDARRLSEFLQREVECGRLRPCSVGMVARLLLAPSLSLVMDSVVRQQPLPDEAVDQFADALVATLWDGLAPGDE